MDMQSDVRPPSPEEKASSGGQSAMMPGRYQGAPSQEFTMSYMHDAESVQRPRRMHHIQPSSHIEHTKHGPDSQVTNPRRVTGHYRRASPPRFVWPPPQASRVQSSIPPGERGEQSRPYQMSTASTKNVQFDPRMSRPLNMGRPSGTEDASGWHGYGGTQYSDQRAYYDLNDRSGYSQPYSQVPFEQPRMVWSQA